MSGTLSVVGTPIGNLEDLSPRAAATLQRADIIACEDTRVTRKLLARLPERSRARLVSTHARNEAARAKELARAAAGGKRVALVTDAGMPGVSDPGHRVVAACRDAGVGVEVVPGPSAVTAAVIASGLPSARFVFEGFLPRTGKALRTRIAALVDERRTIVVFEAPHRLGKTLAALADALGARRAAIVRELTKVHEEVVRGRLDELATAVAGGEVRGEITIVIEGAPERARAEPDPVALADEVLSRVEAGEAKKEAIAAVAVERGVPKRRVYDAVVTRTRESP